MKVTFSETSEMYIVDCFCEEVAPDKIWFTRDELDSFKSNVVNHIRRLRLQEGRLLADNIIGLERFITREVTEESQRQKNTLMREVLHSIAHDHADRLAKISTVYSAWAQTQARQSAMFLEAVLLWEDLDHHISNSLVEHSSVQGLAIGVQCNKLK